MATAEILIPPSNHVLPGSKFLVTAPFPEVNQKEKSESSSSPESIASEWLLGFRQLLSRAEGSSDHLFLNESYWRDLLYMTWDFRTIQGHESISRFIQLNAKTAQALNLSLDTSAAHKVPCFTDLGGVQVVQACLKVESGSGGGEGIVRLARDSKENDRWKAFTLFTTLRELKGHEERTHSRRPTGYGDDDVRSGGSNWKDRLIAQQNFEDGRQPVVLIIGAGQGGLTTAARLKQLGVETLIIDQNPRIGDNWRNRYHQLVLHDSVWYDHLPYLPFPPTWPIFTPKDKLADWFEYYAGILELNVWTSSTLQNPHWSDSSRQWTTTVVREKNGKKEKRTLHPRHIILATGHSGEPYLPSNISGMDDFRGDRLIHSSQFTGPEKNANGKKAVIVGCCNSGHDIARDYHDHGYDVTMVQRSSTLVVKCDTLIDVTMKGFYDEDGPPLEYADLLAQSTPNPVKKKLDIGSTKEIMDRDGVLLRGLTAAGFSVDSGPDGAGLYMKYLSRGGGYYIDVGTSKLIADRKIKIKQGQEINRIKEHSLVFNDDTELEADEIVFATGYQNMRGSARKIFGDDLADRVHDVWGFDNEGEIRGMWRRSGHPGFWFFGGNLALCRFYSKMLALQIKAIEVGITEA